VWKIGLALDPIQGEFLDFEHLLILFWQHHIFILFFRFNFFLKKKYFVILVLKGIMCFEILRGAL
jgi:hypothetical protein